jgi:methylase of polypeptide subunit release factors
MPAPQTAKIIDVLAVESRNARSLLTQLIEQLDGRLDGNPWFRLWAEHTCRYVDLPEADRVLAENLGLPRVTATAGSLLFCAQTYAALVLDALAGLSAVGEADASARGSLFDWYQLRHPAKYRRSVEQLCALLQGQNGTLRELNDLDFSALLGAVFQQIFPPSLRHLLGEYYTPEWLIDDAYELLDVESLPADLILLDPAGGSGGFAVRLLKRLQEKRAFASATVIVSDVSPIAARFAALNLAFFNKAAKARGEAPVQSKVVLADTICDNASEELTLFDTTSARLQFLGSSFSKAIESDEIERAMNTCRFVSDDERRAFRVRFREFLNDQFFFKRSVRANLICGNPPWISWDGVIPGYRRTLAQQWAGSSLITNKGWRAKVAAGKHDLSTLFVHRSAERHAAPSALMVFALPISVFQGRHSSAGFRLFRAGPTRRYAVTTILDLAKSDVFSDALNRASLGVFRVDQEPAYPIPYGRLTGQPRGDGRQYEWGTARPIDATAEGSPIVLAEDHEEELFEGIARSEYRARGGVNTGGANAILWVKCLARERERVRIINSGKSKGVSLRQAEGIVEAKAVAPLLIGRDIRRWRATPSRHILFLYDRADPKKAIPESRASARFPLAVKYLSQFEADLRARKEYHRWGGAGPFYELYRIGPYTFADVKVVWQHTGYRGRMNVAVIAHENGQVIVPDQKVILLPFEDEDEAHYVCAYLASSIVERVLEKYIGLDASTHILDYIALRRFDPNNSLHRRLAELSKEAHALALECADLSALEHDVDKIASALFFGPSKAAA